MQPPTFLLSDPLVTTGADDRVDPPRAALVKAGTLLVDLADQASRLAALVAEQPKAKNLAGSLARRSELTRQLGRKLALFSDPKSLSTSALVNDAILALDGVAVDVEYAAELATDSKIKNQVARSRLAVTTSGCAIDDARRAIASA